MLASQMADAISEATTVDIDAACRSSGVVYNFRATGSVLKFAGFREVYLEGRDDTESGENGKTLPRLAADDALECTKLDANQHFTEPPPRYTEATLIKAMEEKGIGRPSTYAPTIGTLVDRQYVERERSRLTPTPLGMTVTDLLTEHFTGVMDLDFTAGMEEELDSVAQGNREWVPMLRDFYDPFNQALNKANETFSRAEETDEVCEKCGEPMAIKTGRFGRFMACTGYPKCRNTKDMGDNSGTPFEEATDEVCEKCDRPMIIKTGRYGRFLACTGYNTEENPCDNRRNLLNKTGVKCPQCDGDIVERRARGRGGRPFWGCSRYPDCEFVLNRRPLPTPCPECSGLMVQQGRNNSACTSCSWQEATPVEAEEELVGVGD
jgi:DNA topoisomerase-1